MAAPLLSLWERAAKGWRKMKTRKRTVHSEFSVLDGLSGAAFSRTPTAAAVGDADLALPHCAGQRAC
jgi:hypothetical protein